MKKTFYHLKKGTTAYFKTLSILTDTCYQCAQHLG